MAQAPIITPTPNTTSLQWLTESVPIDQASANAFAAGQFVKKQGTGATLTLIKCADATSGEMVYGLSQKAALAATAEPYLTPTGTTATPILVKGTEFWVNTLTPAGAVGTGDAAALITGSSYQLASFTTSGYSGQQGLDSSSVASAGKEFFIFTGKIYPGYSSTDTNVPVSAKLVEAKIQP
jgi:hypothetical protein